MIKLNRFFTNQTLVLNFVTSNVVCTRFCSDKKPFLEDKLEEKEKDQENIFHDKDSEEEKIKKRKKDRTKLFYILQDDVKKEGAKKSLRNLMKSIKVGVKESEDQPPTSGESKITLPLPQRKTKTQLKKKPKLSHLEVSKSIDEVAKELPGDIEQTRSDLLNKIKDFLDPENATIKKSLLEKPKVSELLKNIDKVEKDTPSVSDRSKTIYQRNLDLGIFSVDFHPTQENEVKLKIWDELEKEHLKFLFSSAPKNYFEELILWTEEGKLWHFPIDNEQGLEEEAKVDFTEHVFLEEHLEPWCPKAGPLRHFMELVITGLSKNPYLTVKDKHEHIYWFRDYFESKKKLLLSLGAYDKKPIAEK